MSHTPEMARVRLYLLGCGKMGSALLRAWLATGIPAHHITARVARESSAAALRQQYGIHASTDATYQGEDAVVLAVKPQVLDGILAEHWHPAPEKPLYLSVIAGKTLHHLQTQLGAERRVIRAMPNTPAQAGQGVTPLVAPAAATETDRALATALCAASGKAIWMADETAFTTAMAVSGSGPAYVFLFAEALLQTAIKLGLPEEDARALVSGTLSGSVALAEAEGWEHISRLRQDVTSKGGVTEAALEVLMPELQPLLERALQANIRRAEALS